MKRISIRPVFVALIFAVGLAVGVGGGVAWANQPHMNNAINYLNQATTELEAAPSDKGGHKSSAETYIAKAIQEVQWGIDYANKYGK